MNGRDLSLFERAPRGGADTWDLGPAGQILTEEFFGAPPAPPAGLQAVRFDNAADVLAMPAAAVPSGAGAWTVAVWLRLSVDRNVPTMVWSFDGLFSSSWHALETDSSGTSLRVYETGVTRATIATLTVGVWYFVVVRKSAGGTIKTYIGDEAFGSLATAAGTVTNMTYAGDGYVGGSAYGDHLDGRLWGMRVWDAELSDAEVDAEFASATGAAVRTTNRRAEWLLDDDVTPGTDSSGNARHLTNTGGSWTLEAGPTFPSGPSTVTADLAGTIGVTTAVGAAHGVAAAVAGTVPSPTSSVGANQAVAGIAGTVPGPTSAVAAAHGVRADVSGVVPITSSVSASHGVAVALSGTIPVTTAVGAASGAAVALAGTVPAPVGAVSAAHGVAASVAGSLPAPVSVVTANSVVSSIAGALPTPTSAMAVTVDSSFVEASLAATVPAPISSAAAAHGTAAAVAGTLPAPTSSVTATHSLGVALAGTIGLTSSSTAAHGVAGSVTGTVSVSSSASASHGVSVSVAGEVPAPTSTITVGGPPLRVRATLLLENRGKCRAALGRSSSAAEVQASGSTFELAGRASAFVTSSPSTVVLLEESDG